MITWMQRHKKYLIITIWISTIAFIGAGFVGWGQFKYGDKASAIAKVGNIEITMSELQKSYSRLYNQYNQMFQGNFDEEKAKSFGLKRQALKQLVNQALLLNLAASYDLQISDEELLDELKTQEYFFKDGAFDKEIYKEVLSRNNLTMKEYEEDVKKQMLIQKTLRLLPVKTSQNEKAIFDTIMSIADKIEYKVLSADAITVNMSDEDLKPYWEKMKDNFKSEVSYDVKYIRQPKISQNYDEAKINEYYTQNKNHFKDKDGKILALEDAKESVVDELNAKETKDTALRGYIAYKKGKLDESVKVEEATLSNSHNPFNAEILEQIKTLSPASPFLKPIFVNGEYFTFELVKTNPATLLSYEEAKSSVAPLYVAEQKREKLHKLADDSYATFKGKSTDFITNRDVTKLADLDPNDAKEFLFQLFSQQNKQGYLMLKSGKVVLFNILEQKLLKNTNIDQGDTIARLKGAMFDEGLIKNLQNKYQTEIFIQGL